MAIASTCLSIERHSWWICMHLCLYVFVCVHEIQLLFVVVSVGGRLSPSINHILRMQTGIRKWRQGHIHTSWDNQWDVCFRTQVFFSLLRALVLSLSRSVSQVLTINETKCKFFFFSLFNTYVHSFNYLYCF
jgi:hypothetical protein